MFPIEPGCWDGRNKELTTLHNQYDLALDYIGVFAGVGHRKFTAHRVLDLEILIGEFSTVDYLSANS